jgi:hypothetical protein
MNMKMVFIVVVLGALSLFVSGCETYRSVILTTNRIEVESSVTNGITPALAVDLFLNVANQIGFVVGKPVNDPNSHEVDYYARESNKYPTNTIYSLSMRIESQQISFTSTIHGTKEDFSTAQKTAALFEQALDRQGIQYRVSTYVVPPIISGLAP